MKRSKLSKLVPTVNILGTEVEVLYKDSVIADDGDHCYGLARFGEQLIEIEDTPNIKYESKLATLLHECLEHINNRLELDLEHSQISSIETTMFQLLRDNPHLCRAFTLYKGVGK